MANKNFYVDVHVLQAVPPSCINRDDTGSPKTAVYGGVTRARVSSQAWKKAVRSYFDINGKKELLGYRTKKIVTMVKAAIEEKGYEGNAEELAKNVLKDAGLKIKSAEKGTEALFFMSLDQAESLAEIATTEHDNEKVYKKACREALKNKPSVDMVLFGRMVADDPSLNYDAAVQVAHSISTHSVHNEYDYFTALDDCQSEDESGAGHLDTTEFNSATLYRYATVNVAELSQHLEDRAAEILSDFIKAFICSMPTGKQNSFANRTLPENVYITVRRDQPVNLCGAFEKPVNRSEKGYSEPSLNVLQDYAVNLYHDYAGTPEYAFGIGKNIDRDNFSVKKTLPEITEEIKTIVNSYIEENGEVNQ